MIDIERIHNINTVIVGNNREYFSPLDSHVPQEEKFEFVQSDIDEADMDIMWLGDDKVVILPYPVDKCFIDDTVSLFGYKNTHIVFPDNPSSIVSQDILQNPNTRSQFINLMKSTDRINLVPWGHTNQFQKLIREVQNEDVKFIIPETPLSQAMWTPDYFDTKIGSRDLLLRVCMDNKDFKIPDGYPVCSIPEALNVSQYFLDQGKGVVLKANLGGAGAGIVVLEPNRFGKNKDENLQLIQTRLHANPLFDHDVILVEEYVRPDFHRHATFPSVDSIILPNGDVEIQSVDGMVIKHDEGHVGFYGCVAGKGLYNKREYDQLYGFAKTIGSKLSALGYRGWFDTDYIATPSGEFYSTEVNLRRTSMSHLVEIGKFLYGNDFENKIAMRSNDKFIRPHLKNLSHTQVKQLLNPLMFPINGTDRGVILTQSYRCLNERGKFGYVIIGKNQDDTVILEKQLEKRLHQNL